MREPFLSLEHLEKRLGGQQVLRDLSLSADCGERLGISGENGAGKTTFMKILASVLRPDAGACRLGAAVSPQSRAWREQLSWVPQDLALDPELSVRGNLRYWAALNFHSRADADTALKQSFADPLIAEFLDVRVRRLSGGMARRANLAVSLLKPAALLLLDEPFAGADEASAGLMEERLLKLSQEGVLLILTSHEQERLNRLSTRQLRLEEGHFDER